MKIIEHFIPIFCNNLDAEIACYERIAGSRAARRWKFDAQRLELCVVRPFVLVSGPDETLAQVKELRAVIYVDNLGIARSRLMADGLEILYEFESPVGPCLYARHRDGSLVEFIEPKPDWKL